MSKLMRRCRLEIIAASICIAFGSSAVYAKKAPELVKQEAGYYYGYAKGNTAEEAAVEAKRDLVSNALTATLRAVHPNAETVKVSAESAKARLGTIKPYAQTKPDAAPAVTYRMKIADWVKEETAYSEALRTDLTARFADVQSKRSVSDKISGSLAILAKLADEGEVDLLTVQTGSTELFSRKVESVCAESSKALVITISVKDGFVDSSSKFSVKAADASGNAVADFPLSVTWEVSSLPTNAEVADAAPVSMTVKTNSLGTADIDYPSSNEYHNRPVTLTVTTSFETSVPSSAVLKKLDTEKAVDAHYVQFDDAASAFAAVKVPAGKFNAGAVAQDTRAGRKEAAHEATTGAYAIDVSLVTNAQYAAFLHATRAETTPEYFDNPDYNQGSQPVVGVSVKDAEAYAAWLSEQTGHTYRLPTEEEWEKAARAGTETIYPWGDDSPAEAQKANYKGNGQFNTPSPVGSFANGKNAWGLTDMAGNVWEWTSSTHSKDSTGTLRTVKGGSWMDGPTELRISNSRDLNGQNGYPDVGFRLVMEVSE